MPETQPSKIWYPSQDDTANLPAVLGAMADSIQEAFNAKGNTYSGTSTERSAFTNEAPEGTLWVDTNGVKGIFQKKGANWSQVLPIDIPERPFYAARIWSPAAQSVPNNTNTDIAWSGAFSQLKGMTFNNRGIVIPRTGWYQLSGGARWDANTSGVRQLRIQVDGTNVASAYVLASLLTAHTASIAVRASQGEVVSLVVVQNSGGSIQTRTDLGMPYLSASYLGE